MIKKIAIVLVVMLVLFGCNKSDIIPKEEEVTNEGLDTPCLSE